MPKLKTHKGLAKRVRVSPNGKIKRRKAFAGHLMSGKSGDRKRKLKRTALVSKGFTRSMLRALGKA
ncbi:MAG: 50S ribosomal protein L35 [Planctomycetes bacterium GWA2_40_7]|nr:MAG: 50S ribosomal protein L35 [Planctomycetes bacterium GWA2_40_7]OHB47339.1 MAG: 50S ribosomal protein L35 [Planctomycetes bacterium GWF2_40_8]OHB89610.1 MAG: 50S ribosomal protein L35 [Planctomycetes bacterium RIFCSPHIGHO2_02_FULL_40_12]OHC03620.1 MAG: 50S ribosomal protein L35 [Planctomycetes bacterium RIFCSPLOWO2_12_FULL_40_19]